MLTPRCLVGAHMLNLAAAQWAKLHCYVHADPPPTPPTPSAWGEFLRLALSCHTPDDWGLGLTDVLPYQVPRGGGRGGGGGG